MRKAYDRIRKVVDSRNKKQDESERLNAMIKMRVDKLNTKIKDLETKDQLFTLIAK